MRWDDLASNTQDSPAQPIVQGGDDITSLVWELEGRLDDYAVYWRAWAQANGIKDPFQVAGGTFRPLPGARLEPGMRLRRP